MWVSMMGGYAMPFKRAARADRLSPTFIQGSRSGSVIPPASFSLVGFGE
jgi:hypothetical protein